MTDVQTVIELTAVGGEVTLLSLAGRRAVLDAPNGRLSRPELDRVPQISMELPSDRGEGLARGMVGGVSEARRGQNPFVFNPRSGFPADGRHNDLLLDLRIERSTAIIYITDREDPVQDLSHASWSTMSAKVVRLRPSGVDSLELELAPLTSLLDDEELPQEIYRGTGDACPLFTTSDELSISSGLEPSLTDPFAYTLSGVVLETGDLTAQDQIWLAWRDASTGFVFTANAGGNGTLKLEVFGLTTPTTETANNTIVEDGRARNYTIRRDAVAIYILVDGEVVATESSTGTITDAGAVPLTIGTKSSTFVVGEFHTWVIAPTDAELSTLLERVATPLPAGIKEINRDGFGDVWPGDNSTDTDGAGPFPTFGYGLSGLPEHQGFSRPEALNAVNFVQPEYVRPADFVVDIHFGDPLTAVELRRRGALEAGGFVLNDPGDGLITFTVDPEPMSEIRVSATGDTVGGVYSGLDLLRRVAFFPGSPLVAAGLQADPVKGPPFDKEVAHYLRSVKGGHDMDDVVPEILLGLDAVLVGGVDGKFFVLRVPMLDWAVPVGASDGEADVILVQNVDFAADDIFTDGDAGPGIHTAGMEHSITVDKSEPRDIDHVPSDVTQNTMLRDSLEAKARRGDAFEELNPGHVEGVVVASLYTVERDAFQEAARRLNGFASQRNQRVFRISSLRRSHDSLYELGAKVYLRSGQVGAPDGVPCRVVAIEAPAGEVELVELRLARMQPDEIVATGNFNATVAEISDHPQEESTDFADSTSNTATLRVGFAAPPVSATDVDWQFRLRIKGAGAAETRVEIALSESGSTISTLNIVVLAGTAIHSNGLFTVAVGALAVFGASFDPTDVTDLSELECFVTLTGPATATAEVYGLDYRYSVR